MRYTPRYKIIDGSPSLEARLEAILTPEQKEIAQLCGLSSADYAIELVRLSQLKIMEHKHGLA